MDKIVIDKGKEKKEGWKITNDLSALGLETVARHIARCEGKDEEDPKVLEKIKKRIRKPEPIEI